jgi:hypothetical protein
MVSSFIRRIVRWTAVHDKPQNRRHDNAVAAAAADNEWKRSHGRFS